MIFLLIILLGALGSIMLRIVHQPLKTGQGGFIDIIGLFFAIVSFLVCIITIAAEVVRHFPVSP